jgi:uncharacterized protein YcbK (DUF882 family)
MQFVRAAGMVGPARVIALALVSVFGLTTVCQAGAAGLPSGAANAKLPRPATPAPAGPSLLPKDRGAKGKKPRIAAKAQPVILYHVNHRETLRLRMADDLGRPVRGLQGQINRFLRCHYTKKQKAMNPRLTRLLFEIGKHYAGRRIEVVSGYRHPRFAKNPRSPHMKGLACDMRVAGVKNTELRDFFRQRFKSVGVGYYPNSSFVHLDVRRGASAFWIDYSGPGETALYARNASEDLRTGRADRWKRTTINPAWADWPEEEEAPGADMRTAAEAAPVEGEEAEVPAESGTGAPRESEGD